jgi:hypothetical protein
MQAIADLIASDMTTGDLSVVAIATATRDAILNRVLAGNHDTAATVGLLLQYLDATISSRHASGAAVAKSPATLAAADVTGNLPADVKAWNAGALPTIGTSTLTEANVRTAVGLAAANLDTQLGDIPTVAEFEARTLAAASYFDPATDEVTTDSASRTASKADVSGLSTFDASSDKVYLANGAHGGAAATIVLSDYSDFQGAGASLTAQQVWEYATRTLSAGAITSSTFASDAINSGAIATTAAQEIAGWVFRLPESNGGYSAMQSVIDDCETAASATGEGAYTGTLTITDGSTGLEGAKVHARRGGVLIATGTTDANGQITDFVFDANTYSLAVSLGGYDTATDTITVSGNAWAKTISLTAFAISPPDDVSLCTVQFRVKLGNTAVQGAICKATLQGTNVAADGTVLSKTAVTDTTDGDGVAELQLVRSDVIVKGSKLYGIQVTYNGVTMASKLCEIPAQSTVLFEDLL